LANCEVCKFHEGLKEKIEANKRENDLQFRMINEAVILAQKDMERRLKDIEDLVRMLDIKIEPIRSKSNIAEGSEKWIAIIIQVIISIIVVVVFSKIKFG
jgi:hypothetical protein